jgi:hypothetical protein
MARVRAASTTTHVPTYNPTRSPKFVRPRCSSFPVRIANPDNVQGDRR